MTCKGDTSKPFRRPAFDFTGDYFIQLLIRNEQGTPRLRSTRLTSVSPPPHAAKGLGASRNGLAAASHPCRIVGLPRTRDRRRARLVATAKFTGAVENLSVDNDLDLRHSHPVRDNR